jgi:ADP-ribose pyrophosphatase
MIEPWPKISETPQKVGWKLIIQKQFMMPDGKPGEYTTVGKIGGQNAAIIALTEDNQVVVARQFRAGPEAVFDELPGGGVNEGEDPADGALRELLEETGYSSEQQPTKLGTACRDAYINETSNYYLLRGCRQLEQPKPDGREFVEPALISISALIANAMSGQMSDTPAILLAYETLKEIQHG